MMWSIADDHGQGSGDPQQVDDEDEGATSQPVTVARGPIRQLWRDHELATPTDAHARNPLLPPGDEPFELHGHRLGTVPGRVELLTRFEVDAHIMDLDLVTGLSLVAITGLDIGDLQRLRRFHAGKVDLRSLQAHNVRIQSRSVSVGTVDDTGRGGPRLRLAPVGSA